MWDFNWIKSLCDIVILLTGCWFYYHLAVNMYKDIEQSVMICKSCCRYLHLYMHVIFTDDIRQILPGQLDSSTACHMACVLNSWQSDLFKGIWFLIEINCSAWFWTYLKKLSPCLEKSSSLVHQYWRREISFSAPKVGSLDLGTNHSKNDLDCLWYCFLNRISLSLIHSDSRNYVE
jgi:hypothetical protein